MQSDIQELQETIDLHFKDQALLQEALVHRSFLNENPDFVLSSNERLEFLGDALLDFIVGEYLYQSYPEMDEGQLTSLRAALIREKTLAQFAQSIRLGDYLYLSRGEEEGGGRSRVGLLADAFEALVAAIYLDRGLEAVMEFVMSFVELEATHILETGLGKDHKSRLQEWAQAEFQLTPVYRTVMERGPDHAKEFTVEVLIGDKVYGRGEGRSKQAGEQKAAEQALEGIARSEI
jgi:ribonuclease-3